MKWGQYEKMNNRTKPSEIISFAAALDFEPQSRLDWNLCLCAYAYGSPLRRISAWPGLDKAQFYGIVNIVVKSIVQGVRVDTLRSKHSYPTRKLLEFLGVNFEIRTAGGTAIRMCYWCRERMTPAHRYCQANNEAWDMCATYDSGMYATLKYATIIPPPPREELPRVRTLFALPQPIAEEIAEHMI